MKYSFIYKWFDEKVLFIVAFLSIGLYYLPYILLGENAKLQIHDNLDSNVAWVKVLMDSGNMLTSPSAIIHQIFGGISHSSLYGTYDISLIWFKLFGMYWGYVFNKILMSFVGFIGMYYLLKKYFLSKDVFIFIPFGVALIFSLLPFWSFTMSVCGLPLVLFSFLNIRDHENHFTNWLVLFLFPLYSSLILSGLFFVLLITIMFFYDVIKSKKVNVKFLSAIFLFGCVYLISHFPLVYNFFVNSGEISHRTEFMISNISLSEALFKTLEIFTFGQYHAHSLHSIILLPIIFGCYLIIRENKARKYSILILTFIIITSFFYGFIEWGFISTLNNKFISHIPIQLDRFHFLHPMFWYILFASSLSIISISFRFGKQVVLVLLFVQFVYVIKYHELIVNRNSLTYHEFYSEKQFNDIKTFINKPQSSYRVISLAMHPAIAQFNGFYTLDGYICDYPLKYKHAFREIIAPELDKDKELKDYYDNWGSRCYAFSSEIKRDFLNSNHHKIEQLDFNFDVLKKMGGEFIISCAEINTINNSRVRLLKTFVNTDSYWKIYLYEVI